MSTILCCDADEFVVVKLNRGTVMKLGNGWVKTSADDAYRDPRNDAKPGCS